MNKDEAIQVIKILLEADGGCYTCAYSLIKLFIEDFPNFKDVAKELYYSKFNKKIDGDWD